MTAEIPIVSEPEYDGEHRSVGRTARILLLVVSAGAAISNFGIIFVASKALDVQENKEFLVFWALLFGVIQVLTGIQNETTRATTSGTIHGARVLSAGALWGLVLAAVIGASSPLWAASLLPVAPGPATVFLVLTALVYPLHVTLLGALGGTGRWEWFSSTLLLEVGLRVALVVLAWLLGARLSGMEGATATAVAALVVSLAMGRGPRRAAGARADVGLGTLMRQQGLAMASTACTAVLINAYPALVAVTTPQDSLGLPPAESAALMGGCMLAVTLTRAPIMMPLTVFVGVAISAFTDHRGDVRSAVQRPFLMLLGVGALGAVAAWPVGPWALRIFKPEYDLPGWYFAVLTLSSVFMAWMTILGALALATKHHVLYVAGWLVASATGTICLLLPLHLTITTFLSVSVGPLAGCAVVFLALQRSARADADVPTV